MTKIIEVGKIKIGGDNPLALIAGPCVIETEKLAMETAETIKKITEKLGIVSYVYKSSFQKDNRSSAKSYNGPGIKEGLRILKKVKETFGIPVLSDVHSVEQAKEASEILDIVQLPAFLCMQTDLTIAIARTGKVVNIKKGQFIFAGDVKNIIKKVEDEGNYKVLVTERGNFYGYHNLMVDFRSLPIMRSFGYPVILDPTHSVRMYGKPSSDPKGGQPEFIPHLTRAGISVGIDALFIETHPDAPKALCDSASMLPLQKLKGLLEQSIELHQIAKKYIDFKTYDDREIPVTM